MKTTLQRTRKLIPAPRKFRRHEDYQAINRVAAQITMQARIAGFVHRLVTDTRPDVKPITKKPETRL